MVVCSAVHGDTCWALSLATLGLQVLCDGLCCSWGPGQLFHCPSQPAPLGLGGAHPASAFPLLSKGASTPLALPFLAIAVKQAHL